MYKYDMKDIQMMLLTSLNNWDTNFVILDVQIPCMTEIYKVKS